MSDRERMLDQFRPLMEAIVFIKDGTVDKFETPYGKEIPPSDRSPVVQRIVEMYSDWPYRMKGRLFVYPDGHFGAAVDD